jgi:hypothetical protein
MIFLSRKHIGLCKTPMFLTPKLVSGPILVGLLRDVGEKELVGVRSAVRPSCY